MPEKWRANGQNVTAVNDDKTGSRWKWPANCDPRLFLKKGPLIDYTPKGRVYVASYGQSGMATAGSGDVLTGCIAAMLGMGAPGRLRRRFPAWLRRRSGGQRRGATA